MNKRTTKAVGIFIRMYDEGESILIKTYLMQKQRALSQLWSIMPSAKEQNF
jgi:hypothetical protein